MIVPDRRLPTRTWARWLFPAVIVGGLVAYGALGGPALFSLEELQARQAELRAWVGANFLLALAAFLGIATTATAVCLPVNSVMCLAAGALFDFWLGTAVISLATTLGATIAFLMTRYLFHDFVQERWGDRLQAIHRGLERDGAYYLFTLRMVPLSPFFVVNALMGLTRVPVRTYWWVTQLGMLPLMALGVNAGTQLSHIRRFADVASPSVLLSLALLGIVPLVFRLLLARLRSRPGLAELAQGSEELS